MVADMHQLQETQDPGPDPTASEKSSPDPHQSKSWIRIRIKGDADPQHCFQCYFLFFFAYL
jgi:hypothetical protein